MSNEFRMPKYFQLAAALGVSVSLAFVATACGDDEEELPAPSPTPAVRIDMISPTSGAIGSLVSIRGSGFTAEDNDIAFSHEGIDFQGSDTAYLNHLTSVDGQTLVFELPEVLGACAFSQLGADEACPDIGLVLPPGEMDVQVVNANGTSNAVTFEVLESASD